MAPSSQSRQLLVWTLPSIAILLSFLWYRRKRSGQQSDPGDTRETQTLKSSEPPAVEPTIPSHISASNKPKRSLSGVESSPIDIVIPHSIKSTKSVPAIISDEDLDMEIEKVKSQKSPFAESCSRKRVRSALSMELQKSKTPEAVLWSDEALSPHPKREAMTATVVQETEKPIAMDFQTAETIEKLSTLSIQSENCKKESLVAPGCGSERLSSERDSANHSPVDALLASPSLSSISDNHSEGSSDSGKGCSDVATPAGDGSLSGDVPTDGIRVYEFTLPQQLVGRLIGRHGVVIQQIKLKTNANILIKRHPESNKFKLCAVEGSQTDIDNALKLIRQKFPEKRYPSMTLEQVHFPPPTPQCTVVPECLYLKLVEAINNDTVISYVESPVHLFLQQHTHPSYPSLNRLVNCMTTCYKQSDSPMLPKPIQDGSICAACLNECWYRATVISTDEESDMSIVQFMDFGGYCNIENSLLRQIRADFVTLPFQASECILANLRLSSVDSEVLPEYGIQVVQQLTKGRLLQTQVVGYTPNRIPMVFIYIVVGPGNVIFLNRAIVEHGLAEWVEDYKV